ncbi:phosphoribosylanthranilate isomerase [Chryseobacterium salipaludis]|uniref:phosphoribosylanthranilate isomerase n=1 Tax=Chryseobacterium TaxID=59732 RepID=UPI001FF1DC8D|nr:MULTISPECIES: phosphoribosylanthranilate isomerase [Chryseobacterium]MCJ8498755.1 phosphoribosylanthranilate isomerase [Chryseobacterium salipaludis]MCX3297323.1 phosphoribosylanthranilate isomerase [Planobacterium sp. JC490]
MIKPRVKICCISSIEEARMAIEHGAAALGLVGHMPSGPGVIGDGLIAEIAKTVPPPVATFLLTSETKPQDIISHYKRVNTNTIQIVDALEKREYGMLRKELPNVKLVQVIHVIDDHSVKEAIEISSYVDAILLDSGNPNLSVKELGGTGRTHNWELSKEIRESVAVPLFLAGGLNKDNVRQAIDSVQPFGLDLCSSVRTEGKLDPQKLKAFFEAME